MVDKENLEKELQTRAEAIDGIDVPTPDFMFFKDLVDREQAKVHRAQRLQLALFVAVAAVVVAALLFCLGNYRVFFFALQGAAAASALCTLIVVFLRRRSLREGAR